MEHMLCRVPACASGQARAPPLTRKRPKSLSKGPLDGLLLVGQRAVFWESHLINSSIEAERHDTSSRFRGFRGVVFQFSPLNMLSRNTDDSDDGATPKDGSSRLQAQTAWERETGGVAGADC